MTAKRHIFVFRHCLRSTEATVDLRDGSKEQPLANFFPNLPNWNVPPEWCTEMGMKLSQATGEWLAKEHLSEVSDIRILSDLSQRDVDSALALSKGLAPKGVVVSNIQLDPTLFQPTKANNYDSNVPLCEPVSNEILLKQVQARVKEFPIPQSIAEAVKLVQTMSNAMNITLHEPEFELYAKDAHFIGPINLIKIFAQSLFYSRASGIPYLPHISSQEVLKLQHWIAWSRHVLTSGTSKAAQGGAALVQRILETFRYSTDNNKSLIIMGHDSNLDALSTLLKVDWGFPEYGKYSPTPPGSGIHFELNDNYKVSVSMIYPVYNLDIKKRDATTEEKEDDFELKEIKLFDEPMSLNDLNKTIVEQLEHYEGAMECFVAAAASSPMFDENNATTTNTSAVPISNAGAVRPDNSAPTTQPPQHSSGTYEKSSHYWLAFLVIGAGMWVFLRRGQRRNNYETYSGVEMMS